MLGNTTSYFEFEVVFLFAQIKLTSELISEIYFMYIKLIKININQYQNKNKRGA